MQSEDHSPYPIHDTDRSRNPHRPGPHADAPAIRYRLPGLRVCAGRAWSVFKSLRKSCTPRGNVWTRLAPMNSHMLRVQVWGAWHREQQGLFRTFRASSCQVQGPPTQATPEPLPAMPHIADPKWRGFAPYPPHSGRRPVPHHAPPPVLNSPSNAFESVRQRAVDYDQIPYDAAVLRVACRVCVHPRAGRISQARSLLSHLHCSRSIPARRCQAEDHRQLSMIVFVALIACVSADGLVDIPSADSDRSAPHAKARSVSSCRDALR